MVVTMRTSTLSVVLLAAFLSPLAGEEASWFDRKTEWQGYDRFHFNVRDRSAYVVAPKNPVRGKPWIWRARFPEYHAEMDAILLSRGYHIGYVDVAELFGNSEAVAIGDAFYAFATSKLGLSTKPALEGVSRGGLLVYNWAAKNLDKVSAIYCDTPVLDIKSWPGGKGTGLSSPPAWERCLNAYGLTEETAASFAENPLDHAHTIAAAKIPVMHIVSENDRVVPPRENTYLLRDRFSAAGHTMELISVPEGTDETNGHHFDHPDPERVVDFLARHARARGALNADRMALLRNAKRVVFLGDSITYAGHYVGFFEVWMHQQLASPPLVIDMGLSSETVSGLSEDGHAGGRFPRPDLTERLARVLHVTTPDLVFACYGINCGIYQPFDLSRFEKYKRGIEHLKRAVEESGAQLVLITPPTFDDHRAQKEFSYNKVLDRYTEWLVRQREQGWFVIDLHTAMTQALTERREASAEFTFQPDSVHPNMDGHWFMATHLFRWFGDNDAAHGESPEGLLETPAAKEYIAIVKQRLDVRRNAYLSAAGHKRPGVEAGLPVEEAEQEADRLTATLAKLRVKTTE